MSSMVLNTEALERFKNKIDYSAVKNTLPLDKKLVHIDWKNVLNCIDVDANESWMVVDRSISLFEQYHVESNTIYENENENENENDNGDIDIDVHVFSDLSNVEVLEEAMVILSRTSMMDINMEYDKNGPGNVYFFNDSRAISIFRNVILDINISDDIADIRFVANSILEKIISGVTKPESINKFGITYSITPQAITINEEFTIQVYTPPDNSYQVKLLQVDDDLIEFINMNNHGFKFKANKRGQYKIIFAVIDNHFLSSEILEVVVNIP